MVGVSSTITSVRRLLRVLLPNNAPSTGMRLSPGTPLWPLVALSVIRPAIMMVSPLCTAASVASLRVEIRGLHEVFEGSQLAGTSAALLTSCTTSMNTMPSRVTRGRTFRITPVSMYCTWL
ncbi:hypothetical protein D3C81_712430 [compost metagenome]